MNIHAIQTIEARVESIELMCVSKQIISPAKNAPIMSLVMDDLLGISLMSYEDVFLTRERAMHIIASLDKWTEKMVGQPRLLPAPAILKPVPLWTGKQIISLLIPKGVHMKKVAPSAKRDTLEDVEKAVMKDTLLIIDGDIISGRLSKKCLGNASESLVHVTFMERGHEKCAVMIHDMQNVANRYIAGRSYTIGMEDCETDKETQKAVRERIEEAKKQVDNITEDYNRQLEEIKQSSYSKRLKEEYIKHLQKTYENTVSQALNKARDDAGNIAYESVPKNNKIKMMVEVGSKGSSINLFQVAACVGQQTVNGQRPPLAFSAAGDRALPHYAPGDMRAEARGMVSNSFSNGLNPQEFFFHTMGGREGLIDTAVKVTRTGYMQRRIVKASEDVFVGYDGTVRNSLGNIVQFMYGEDGLDGMRVRFQILKYVEMSNNDFDNNVHWQVTDNVVQKEYDQLLKDREFLRWYRIRTGVDSIPMASNVFYLIAKYKIDKKLYRFPKGHQESNPQTIKKCIDIVQRLCQSLRVTRMQEACERNQDALTLFRAHVRFLLCSKRVLHRYRFTPDILQELCDRIAKDVALAVVCPGEMVGIVSAQSIGEPSTQMTLNTFHLAGIASRNVCQGVPRVQELINATNDPSTPSNLFIPKIPTEIANDEEKVIEYMDKVANDLQCRTLESLVTSMDIVSDPEQFTNSIIESDKEPLNFYWEVLAPEELDKECEVFKSALRIAFNGESLLYCHIDLVTVALTIEKFLATEEIVPNHAILVTEIPDAGNVIRITFQQKNKRSKKVNREKQTRKRKRDEDDNTAMQVFVKPRSVNRDKKEREILERVESALRSHCLLKGLSGIVSASRIHVYNKTSVDPDTGRLNISKGWMIDTEGINMAALLSHPVIEPMQLESNHPLEVLRVYGGSAARMSLIKEIKMVLTSDGSYVNYRHIALLADIMTHRGYIMPITRFGVNRLGTGVLMRCSFEQTLDILAEAAVFGEVDNILGPSENVMVGKRGSLGTGMCSILPGETRPLTPLIKPKAKNYDHLPITDTEEFARQLDELKNMLAGMNEDDTAKSYTPKVIDVDPNLPWLKFMPKE